MLFLKMLPPQLTPISIWFICCFSRVYERELIIERTYAGLKAARARGHLGGRPRKMNVSTLRMASAAMATTIKLRKN